MTAAAIAGAGDLPFAAVEEVLERACGLSFSAGVRPALADAVRRASRELGLAREPFLSRLLGGDPAAASALAEHALVRETCFHRHPEQWASVTRWLAALPPDRPLSAWSAGCATGATVLQRPGEERGAGRGASA